LFQEIPGVSRGVEDFVEEAIVNALYIGGYVFHPFNYNMFAEFFQPAFSTKTLPPRHQDAKFFSSLSSLPSFLVS